MYYFVLAVSNSSISIICQSTNISFFFNSQDNVIVVISGNKTKTKRDLVKMVMAILMLQV